MNDIERCLYRLESITMSLLENSGKKNSDKYKPDDTGYWGYIAGYLEGTMKITARELQEEIKKLKGIIEDMESIDKDA